MSVQNLRKSYINQGKVTVSHDAQGKPYIELSECLRAFPERFKLPQQQPIAGNPVTSGFVELQQKNDALTQEMDNLRERLRIEEQQRRSAEELASWLRNHVDKLTEENIKLLDAPRSKKSGWFAWLAGK